MPPGALGRVLVAEDNKLNSVLIAEQLRALGFDAEIHANGSDALACWRGGEFAAVLTDVNMPGMDGFELAVAIRAEEVDGAHTPIIALTADAFLDRSSRWKAAGVDACLTKPIELASLKAVLEQWIAIGAAAAAPAPREATDDAGEAVDRAILPTIVGDHDPRTIAELLSKFARAAEAAATIMAAAMQSGRRAEVGSQAHQLRASAGAVGAARLSRLCACIESAALGADEQALTAAWEPIPAEVQRVTAWISAEAAGAGAAKPGGAAP